MKEAELGRVNLGKQATIFKGEGKKNLIKSPKEQTRLRNKE